VENPRSVREGIAIDVKPTAHTTLPHQPTRLTDNHADEPIRGFLRQFPAKKRINYLVVERVKGREPLLIGDQVRFVWEVIGLINDRGTTVATDFHGGTSNYAAAVFA
jgi:hypothetical protein